MNLQRIARIFRSTPEEPKPPANAAAKKGWVYGLAVSPVCRCSPVILMLAMLATPVFGQWQHYHTSDCAT